MKKQILSVKTAILLMSATTFVQAQTNEFKIGMFGVDCRTQNVSGCDVPYLTTTDVNGKPTSTLNVIAEDGFNIVQDYGSEWLTESATKNRIKLVQANGLMVEIGQGPFFLPYTDASGYFTGYGTEKFDNCGHTYTSCQSPAGTGYNRHHIDNDFANIYTVSPYKDVIWGYHISEEASKGHANHKDPTCYGNYGWAQTEAAAQTAPTGVGSFLWTEIPPANVLNAVNHMKTKASGLNHKMIVMEANHGSTINSSTDDKEGYFDASHVWQSFENTPFDHDPQEYIQQMSPFDSRDVFFEGSYFMFPSTSWQSQVYATMGTTGHYLGGFKSIDYGYNYSSDVHKVVASYVSENPTEYYNSSDNSGLVYSLHSDYNTQNANWLWNQAYTSIIHKAKGVWFWWLFNMWKPGENTGKWTTSDADRFERTYYPSLYKDYVSNLSKELRYLVNKNLISTDPNNIVLTKTDQADGNCIVPAASTYVPSTLPAEFKTENYGLRYSIRTNGTEIIMIISNPLNVPITTTLNFSNVANTIIRNSAGVEYLFETAVPTSTSVAATGSSGYKMSLRTSSNTNINLTSNTLATGAHPYQAFSTGQTLPLSFGPLDVHILKFTATPTNYVAFNTDKWQTKWSNGGSGQIAGWTISANDKYYTGDFDGNGVEEMLCISGSGTNDWMTKLHFENGQWYWDWSNYGSTSHAMYNYRNKLYVGDFDGDGADELLGINTTNSWIKLFKFSSGDFVGIGDNQGSSSSTWLDGLYPYRNTLTVGDFDNDGRDEALGVAGDWMTLFHYNSDNNWHWGWSNYGSTSDMMYAYRNNFSRINTDGDGDDEILGQSSWATTFSYSPSSGLWQWGASTNGNTYLGSSLASGWAYPVPANDKLYVANIDAVDAREELFLLNGSSKPGMVRTMDYGSGQATANWGNSPNTSSFPSPYTNSNAPYINDWLLIDGNATDQKLLFLKTTPGSSRKSLLCMKKYGTSCSGGKYLASMYETISSTDNFRLANNTVTENVPSFTAEIVPNPNTGTFKLIYSGQFKDEGIRVSECRIDVFNYSGQVLYSAQRVINHANDEQSFNLGELPGGIYILRVTNGTDAPVVKRFVIMH